MQSLNCYHLRDVTKVIAVNRLKEEPMKLIFMTPREAAMKMNALQAAKILKRHNKWRRGGNTKPTDPARLGMAIDAAVELIENTAFVELAKKANGKEL